ncbi:sn-glycerol-3-phosphate ABC transporter ATP-binding protein UgpC [Allorhizobium sp. BGMRC 0089]|uniref:ABC transporter ATP-binding protein n=1 Tax=Allorhizobium sonneratiae TaxID=2934936 RepID=UPI002033E4E0|nr:sn-glycerol-3-phosphate ABC transporter ATP-binding protein UgpC [Allorhizobium sonneratiae]MCM2291030.1 sn-glycerol-3-phosphate ABC transporter ATP-binding protein UgpC [Allorhizobium sonneratiae]
MASVSLRALEKSYGAAKIVKGIDLDIADGEFVVFVGPSGCGKSTTLRMVAGLETISGGEVRIGERTVNTLAPRERDIAMVFQDYALYPHKSVRDNMGFSLKVRGIDKREAEKRIQDAADMLGISHLLDRRPGQLSGGQRQRVAMGRAIVRRPQVFLFDEPLSNLDAKLRGQVRTEIKRLHQTLGATIIYVTHDQVEAMTLADRIVILRGGEIEQVGTPDEVYHTPHSVFVGGFVGSPAMNFASAVVQGDALVFANGDRLSLAAVHRGKTAAMEGLKIIVGIRPEHFTAGGDPAMALTAKVQVVEPLGADTLVHFTIDGQMLTARMAPDTRPQAGDELRIGIDPARLHLFDTVSEKVIH